MMGMTMAFSVSDPRILDGIAGDQIVDFRVRDENGRHVVTEIRPSSSGARPGGHEYMESNAEGCGCAAKVGDRSGNSDAHRMGSADCRGMANR